MIDVVDGGKTSFKHVTQTKSIDVASLHVLPSSPTHPDILDLISISFIRVYHKIPAKTDASDTCVVGPKHELFTQR